MSESIDGNSEGGEMESADQLRDSMHRVHGAEDPAPLDPGPIIAAARLRRARNRTRMMTAGFVLALVALGGSLLPQLVSGQQSVNVNQSRPQAAAPQDSTSTGVSSTRAGASRADAAGGIGVVEIRGDQWCADGAAPRCRALTDTRAEISGGGVRNVLQLTPPGTSRVEPVRPGAAEPRLLLTGGDQQRLVVVRPATTPEPLRALAADGRVLATLD